MNSRLDLALLGLQPVIRHILFPSSRAEIREKPAVVGLYDNSEEEEGKHQEHDLLGHGDVAAGGAAASDDVPDLL